MKFPNLGIYLVAGLLIVAALCVAAISLAITYNAVSWLLGW